jgi:hypothetical protein
MTWLNPYRWLVGLGLVAALVLGYFFWAKHEQGIGEARATTRYEAALRTQKDAAAALLASEAARTAKATAQLRDFTDHQETADAQHQKDLADLSARLRTAAGAAGRLRDPNAPGCGRSSAAPSAAAPAASDAGTDNPAAADGLLSAELTQFLLQQAAQADAINDAYASSRADGLALRLTLEQWRRP